MRFFYPPQSSFKKEGALFTINIFYLQLIPLFLKEGLADIFLILPNPPLKRRELHSLKYFYLQSIPLFLKEGLGEIFRDLTSD